MKTQSGVFSFMIIVLCIFCVSFDTTLHASGTDTKYCDLNSDGNVSIADAVYLMRYIAEDDAVTLSQSADLNSDHLISILDVKELLRMILQNAVPEQEPQITTTAVTSTAAQTFTHTTQTIVTTFIRSDYPEDLKTLPPYDQKPYVTVNQNQPYRMQAPTDTIAYEYYSPLDELRRCGVCEACIGQELMPTEERGSIGMVKPSGWQLSRYDGIVDGNYLYNRCHLIGFQLTGENANDCNLITGTRYLNVTGMLPFENRTADYIKATGNHVYYRVTPYFENSNLVASGVLMEAHSVEDHGEGLCFNVFCYNVQPQIYINYATGENSLLDDDPAHRNEDPAAQYADYVVNTNSKKFHLPDCTSAAAISQDNRWDYSGSRDDLIAQGYEPCKRCNP